MFTLNGFSCITQIAMDKFAELYELVEAIRADWDENGAKESIFFMFDGHKSLRAADAEAQGFPEVWFNIPNNMEMKSKISKFIGEQYPEYAYHCDVRTRY